jgi:hypothetical protein
LIGPDARKTSSTRPCGGTSAIPSSDSPKTSPSLPSLGNFGIQSTYTDPYVEQDVCHIGWAAEWTRGSITSVNGSCFVTDFATDKCDSGGIVYHRTPEGRAAFLGILIGMKEGGGIIVESANYLRDTIDANATGPRPLPLVHRVNRE